MTERPHCTCVVVQNLSVEEAADRLRCRPRKLTEELRKKRIPHQRIGDQRVLCECELQIARRVFTILPAVPLAEEPQADSDTSNVTSLKTIKPAAGRRRKTAAG
ncbi:hypothetical protein [Streptomyces sp. NPDC047070]|uniref:hypothetical protein n=1 Tax=Streptomyces sp. NPDC047070 TaxID=3154923 RepID=UPI00345672E5